MIEHFDRPVKLTVTMPYQVESLTQWVTRTIYDEQRKTLEVYGHGHMPRVFANVVGATAEYQEVRMITP